MTNHKMYMAETCAGYMEKPGAKGQSRLRWIQWIVSELILLVLLVAAGIAWFEYMTQYRGNYAVSSIPKNITEQSACADIPVPENMQGMSESIFFDYMGKEKQVQSYYAGPVGDVIKTPEGITVVIDPGHGGIDDGCARGGILEKNVNLSIALEVQKRLEKLGYQVVMTRDTDESLGLGERVQTAKEAQGDIFVSIHQNSSNLYQVNGLEIYYSVQNAETDSRRLAELIHKDVLLDTGAKARSIFEWEDIRVIRESEMPACLVETGFLTNRTERRRLADPVYQGQIADGIASGINQYFQPEVAYLTFDSKNADPDTGKMLTVLKEQNIKATFFVTEKTAGERSEAIEQIAEAGHTIGIYENRQDYRMIDADVDSYLEDLKDTFEKITKVTGKAPVLYHSRGAAGTYLSSDVLRQLENSGFAVYNWTPGL